jgi:hypothetical protein
MSTYLYRTLLLALAMLALASAAAMASVPNAPAGLRYIIGGNPGQRYITLEWASGDSITASPYHVYQGTGSGGSLNFSQIATLPDSGFHGYYFLSPPSGVYTFYVTAFNNDGESAASNYVTVDFSNVYLTFDSSTYRTTATLGVPMVYKAHARASNGDSSIAYELVNPLPGMTINSGTGEFSWTPDRVGFVSFQIRAHLVTEPAMDAVQYVYIVVGTAHGLCATIEGDVHYTNGDNVLTGYASAYPLDSSRGGVQRTSIINGHYSINVQDSLFYMVEIYGGNDYVPQIASQPVILGCGESAVVDFTVPKIVSQGSDSAIGYVRLRSNGSPVMAIVTALDSNRVVIGTARTDQNGFYGMVFPRHGAYYVHAQPLDSTLLDQYYDHSATINGATLLSSGVFHENINFDLDARVVYNNSISGTLIGQTNEQLNGLITAYAITQRAGHVIVEYSGYTLASGGSFSFSNLPPGTYVLFADPADSTDWVAGYYRENHKAELDWQDATQLTITANTNLTGIEIKLSKANGHHGHGRVHGNISGEEGRTKQNDHSVQGTKPIAGALVYAIDPDGELSGYATTDADGYYEIRDLGTGLFTIQVDRIGFKGSKIVVNVVDNESSEVPATLQLAESVSGVPVAGTSIATMEAYPNPARTAVTLSFEAAHGEATVTMVNVAGVEVLSRKITTIDGANTIGLETGSLGAGLYFVKVVGEKGMMSIPVTIVR